MRQTGKSQAGKTTTRLGALALVLCAALYAQAPAFDTSGNGLLSGTYYFRHTIYVISTGFDSQGVQGDTSDSIVVYGNITFDGNGKYTIAGGTSGGIASDAQFAAGPTPLACYLAGAACTSGPVVNGTYAVSASGYAMISSPIGAISNNDQIYGLVSAKGIFVGSSTETNANYSDMFIAAPLANPAPTVATFQGNYTVTGYLPPTGANSTSPALSGDVFFQMNPDGNGNLGTVTVTGYIGSTSTPVTQTSSNVKYRFSNGAAIVSFPSDSTSTLLYGDMYLYFSPDGNFFFGGSPTFGWEMLVGVKNASGTQNFGGLYYESGLDQDLSQVTSAGFANFDAYWGSIQATSSGVIVAHDRLNSVFNSNAIGSTYADSFTPPITGPYTDSASSFKYAVGAAGTIRVGAGDWPYLGMSVALQAPAFTPSGSVYLNPTGVVNAASFSPFTAGIANGEFITLYGTNLAPSTQVASDVPYPTRLNGVQVMINGVAAPIYFVTAGQLAVITPAANPYSLAQIQVINNGNASNVVTVPVYKTVPGVYTIPSGGVGYAAAVHTNGVIVSPAAPAAPGETVEVFTTGLGTVFPAVPDGAAPPISPLSPTTNTITAAVGGTTAVVQFAGLAPTLAGLYQINVTVPNTLGAGDYTLDIAGSFANPTGSGLNPDSYAAQALISIGGGSSDPAARPATALSRRQVPAAKKPGQTRRSLGDGSKPLIPHEGRSSGSFAR
jgi:uncharacterized protein (TIGR03437 family)